MIELVAEIGINANGDIEIAKKLISLTAYAGCQYVKFQKRTIEDVYSEEELNKPRESPWGTTTRQQKEGLEFGLEQYKEIDAYCKIKGIKWFGSAWDHYSVRFLTDFKVPFLKVPSAFMTDEDYLQLLSRQRTPIILSTGMTTIDQLNRAIEVVGKDNVYAILACTSTYPTQPEECNVSFIKTLKDMYPKFKIGFSNHYPGLMAMVMAATLGAEMLEFHVTLDRAMYGSDQAASIEPQGVFRLMEQIKLIDKMRGNGIKQVYESEIPIMKKLRK